MERKKPLKRKTPLTKRTALKAISQSSSAQTKVRIQALLRAIVMRRDGGCILRHYPESGACGGFRRDGGLILQAEHLHTRANAASFADTRLVVCLCMRHHIYYKPQHSSEYNKLVRKHIGLERAALWDLIEENRYKATKVDLKLEELALIQELSTYGADEAIEL